MKQLRKDKSLTCKEERDGDCVHKKIEKGSSPKQIKKWDEEKKKVRFYMSCLYFFFCLERGEEKKTNIKRKQREIQKKREPARKISFDTNADCCFFKNIYIGFFHTYATLTVYTDFSLFPSIDYTE